MLQIQDSTQFRIKRESFSLVGQKWQAGLLIELDVRLPKDFVRRRADIPEYESSARRVDFFAVYILIYYVQLQCRIILLKLTGLITLTACDALLVLLLLPDTSYR